MPGVESGRLFRAAACGTVTAVACLTVFGMLSEDQVEGPYDGGDLTIGIFGAPVVAAVAALLIGTLCRQLDWFGKAARAVHIGLPFGIWAAALISVAAAGGERNNLETGLVWAVAAFLLHLTVSRRVVAVVAAVVVVAGAAGLTVAGQHRWRTQNFARVGAPAYVPEVPGYRLTGAYAGRSNVILRLTGDAGGIDVFVNRSPECRPGDPPRVVRGPYDTQGRLVFCLPEGGQMVMTPDYRSAGIESLLPSVRLVKVDPGFLATIPDGGTEREAD